MLTSDDTSISSVIRKLLFLLSRRDLLQLILLTVMLIFLALLEMAGIASILPFMALVINPEVIHDNRWLLAVFNRFQFESTQSFLIFVGFISLGLLIVGNIGRALSSWLTTRYQARIAYDLSRRLMVSYMARPYAFFLGRNTSELNSIMIGETGSVANYVLRPMVDIVSSSVVAVAILTLLIAVDPTVALVIAGVTGGAYATIYSVFHRKLTVIGEQQVESRAKMLKIATEALSGIKDLKLFGRELTFLKTYSHFSKRLSANNVYSGVLMQLPRQLLETIAYGGILLVVIYLITKGRGATQIIPMLALYAFAGYRLLPTLHTLFGSFATIGYSKVALHVVHAELADEIDPGRAERQLKAILEARPAAFRKSLELRNLHFKYEGASAESVRSLNLTIRPNTVIGLVGPTGCGKTTTIDLILGLLTPSQGEIIVDGVRIDEGNKASWQRALGYVPQQIFICDDTITRNIAFGVPENEIDMAAVRRAATIANLADFIETSLPLGYETNIGERGIRFSGGQRQRIGIARAMYLDPPILIMDEATSALDGITEKGVMDAVSNLSGKKTIILIAHRLSTLKDCDVIYHLEQGAVVSEGTYDQMMQNSTWFQAASRGTG
jgi:ATP-binding cassette, subfamily B, bacterial PglK